MARLPELESVRRRARAAPDLHRRPDPLPPPQGQAGAPDRRRPHPHRLRGVHRLRLRVGARRGAPRGPGQGRRRRPGEHPGAGAQRVPHRRRLRLAALRLRPPAPRGHGRPSTRTAAACSSTCAATRAGASAWPTSCGPTHLQEEGFDTVDANLELGLPADSREYGIGAQILVDLGVTTMRLMTNNPTKYGGLEGFGLDIVERVQHPARRPRPENIEYLRTKRERMGHLLEGLDDVL